MSKLGGKCDGEGDDGRYEGELEFLFRRVRGRRRRVGVMVMEAHVGAEVRVGVDVDADGLSGGPRSFF